MPVYDYLCQTCGHEFQVVESISEHEEHGTNLPECPECEGTKLKRVLSGAFVKTGKKS
jgi:putative FmdB family regulatory protein